MPVTKHGHEQKEKNEIIVPTEKAPVQRTDVMLGWQFVWDKLVAHSEKALKQRNKFIVHCLKAFTKKHRNS